MAGLFDKPKKGEKSSSFLAQVGKAASEKKGESREASRKSSGFGGFFTSDKETKRKKAMGYN